MNPTEENALPPESSSPVVGYCRATGKALTADEATYVNGILYSKEAAENLKISPGINPEPASPYTVPPTSSVPSPYSVPPHPPANDVSPGWAFVLGLIPGVGAIYNQQYPKGLVHIIVFASLISMLERGGNGNVLLAFMLAGWYFYMPFEAYHTAQKRQRGEAVDEMTGLLSLPPGVKKLPIGPFVLIGLGLLFLLDNLGLLRIDDLMRYWPVLMIAAGVILLVNRFQAGEVPNAE